MDKERLTRIIQETSSIVILLEENVEMQKYDDTITNGIRVVHKLIKEALGVLNDGI